VPGHQPHHGNKFSEQLQLIIITAEKQICSFLHGHQAKQVQPDILSFMGMHKIDHHQNILCILCLAFSHHTMEITSLNSYNYSDNYSRHSRFALVCIAIKLSNSN
jgi:hypothetical protein